jgi:SAM-dependent methyltransferase
MVNEIEEIKARYKRRDEPGTPAYDPLEPWVYMALQEKERAIIRWVRSSGLFPIGEKRILEVGCGAGGNLLLFLKLGFRPENIVGNELLEERVQAARTLLPSSIRIWEGDASALSLEDGAFDVVYQSTVFSSILDHGFRKNLADRMWALAKPGGGVLWYDFIYNNPRNKDVEGISVSEIRDLFPTGNHKVWRLTLAPPISRFVAKIHPGCYTFFNMFPFLRTHVLCWIRKG